MDKLVQLQRITESGIVAVVRAENGEQARKLAAACREGGIEAIEITLTVPGAIDVIKEVAEAYPPEEVIIGAGTVLDAESVRAAILAGAEYIVSPHLNPDVVRMANRYQKIVMPGAMSIKEVVEAMELGADAIKLFPASMFGPGMVKAIKGPLPQAEIVPTGGVGLDNVQDWIRAGAVAVGVGGSLTREAINKDDYSILTRKAREFIRLIKEARSEG